MANKINTAMNVLGTVAAGASFLGLGTSKSTFDNKIGEFHSNLGKKGYTKTNRFEVRFNMPPILQQYYTSSDVPKLLTLRCESASIPGVSLSTVDVQRHGYGMSEKVPTGSQFGGFSCSFIGDQESMIYRCFYNWMRGVMNWTDPTSSKKVSDFSGALPYEHNYKKEYVADINMLTYNENSDELTGIDLFDAYPIAIGDIQYNWGDTDNLVRIPIQFAYRNFKLHELNQKFNLSKGSPNSLGIFGTLVKAGTVLQVLGAIKKPQSIGDVINVVNNAKTVLTGFNL